MSLTKEQGKGRQKSSAVATGNGISDISFSYHRFPKVRKLRHRSRPKQKSDNENDQWSWINVTSVLRLSFLPADIPFLIDPEPRIQWALDSIIQSHSIWRNFIRRRTILRELHSALHDSARTSFDKARFCTNSIWWYVLCLCLAICAQIHSFRKVSNFKILFQE